MKTERPHIEIILPVYNEVQNLQPLLRQLDTAAGMVKEEATVGFLFINDGSHDGSTELLHRLYRQREDIRIVDLIHNFGHAAALAAGIDHFEGDIAVIMDADLQDTPSALNDLFQQWKKGAKTVVAERGDRKEKNRLLFKAFYFTFHKIARTLPPINFGTHCLLDKSVVMRLRQMKERNRYLPGLVSYTSREIVPVRVDRQARAHGKSRVGMFGLMNLAVTALLSFSSTPVKMVSVLGLLCAGGSLSSGLFIVAIKLFTERAIPGWASMMTAIFFASGIQLLCLGIIGEYIARIYDEVKDRPLYLVDQVRSKKATARKSA